MTAESTPTTPRLGDEAEARIDDLQSRYPTIAATLLHVLWEIQHQEGWISLEAMKYAAAHGAAAEVLLAPPEPEHPRLRRLLLSTCDNAAEMRTEFARGERTAIERVVYQALLEYVFLPALEADRYSPRRVRERVLRHVKRHPGAPVDPWWLEEEAESFVPWAKGRFVSWSLDVPTLTIPSARRSRSSGRNGGAPGARRVAITLPIRSTA